MLSSIVRLTATRTAGEESRRLTAAVRQLDRADLYLAATTHMEIDDPAAVRTITQLRAEIRSVQKRLHEKAIRLRT